METKREAQKLRDQEWKVSVYRCKENGNPRIREERREPLGDGYGKKVTRVFRDEGEVVAYLGTITKRRLASYW